ncbi:hypothetical protein N7468_008242 [Penicillium chermesinum]|uniref:Putative gamma-glutamylcyclotransferase n=1 Tax=Penicillium chermesinum TaxID=63820 RepID=A0A9W9TJN6_9EURO|nr:uncharacterized protein N7468_008242 [Penicillium chermesinum]KAJ5223700.1 hypothetical protein N7468_008242 [Penicillium chermesinum]
MGDHVLFFYVLHRVIHGRSDPEPWQKATLRFQPAELQGYRRHRVRGADYPAIVASRGSKVLGILVSGLTDGDVYRLDRFEGSEYAHERVKVQTLDQGATSDGDTAKETTDLKSALEASGAQTLADACPKLVDAVAYVWISDVENLEQVEWDFETFKRDKLSWWANVDESEW